MFVRSMFPTVWCICSQIKLDFLTRCLHIFDRKHREQPLEDASNKFATLGTLTCHGPMRSMATSFYGAMGISLSGNKPYPLPDSLCL